MTAAPGARLRALILDFDGVILESNHLKTAVFREVFGRFPEHQDAMMAWHETNRSVPRRAKFEHLVFERLGRPGDKAMVDDLAVDFSSRIFERVCTCPEVPGALAFLERCAPLVPLDLASLTPEPELLSILERRDLRKFFRTVYGCPPWTKPRAVKAIVDGQGGPAGLALVGDTMSDLQAATDAGVEFIGRKSGMRFTATHVPLHADMHAVLGVVLPRLAA